MEARTRGLLTLVVSTLAYAYYSAWLLLVVSCARQCEGGPSPGGLQRRTYAPRLRPPRHRPPQPFIEEDQPTRAFFPPPYFALAPPALAGTALVSAVLVTLGCFLAGPELSK